MSNLNNRIYGELCDWKYVENILNEYSIHQKRKLKWMNAILIFVSLAGIAGWFRFEEYKVFWTVVLILVQGIRLLQNVIFISNEDLFNIKNSIAFYSFNILDLENLYYDYHKGKYSEDIIEKRFNKLREKERDLFVKQTFDKVKPHDKLVRVAENHTDKYLNKIIKNVTNE